MAFDSPKFAVVYAVHIIEKGKVRATKEVLRENEIAGYLSMYNGYTPKTGRLATVVVTVGRDVLEIKGRRERQSMH